ncbi:hypothetical protein CLV57_3557 [Mucilaginibacter auburnensis]|uniref:Uncharacterized protein n=1 Tax=Mucilaginibacter auburnensis TaxID=1457233 RepID=A0A2H9VQ10_9SPHI|nr:hypothetical protein CLV57_3557 [Mucilaginibacter auburnensis]
MYIFIGINVTQLNKKAASKIEAAFFINFFI